MICADQLVPVPKAVNHSPIMTAMPGTSNGIAYLPFLLSVSNRHNFADAFVARNHGERVAEPTMLNHHVRMAHTTGEHFDENLDRRCQYGSQQLPPWGD